MRYVAAMQPSDWYIDNILAYVHPPKLLFSFYYFKPKELKSNEIPRVLLVSKELKSEVFIDSGIYTLKTQQKGLFSLTIAYWQMPEEEKKAIVSKCMEKYNEYSAFANRYIDFLTKIEGYYNWAFDLDVDQFLGIDVADEFYERIVSAGIEREKIIRIWHSSRSFDDWVSWCEGGQHPYLAIEGGFEHRRNPTFYNKMVKVARDNNVKVHVMAITDKKFFARVPVDTGDSSTYTEGGRYGVVRTPWGLVSFGKAGKGLSLTRHYDTISEHRKEAMDAYFAKMGYDVEQLREEYKERIKINLEYFIKYIGTIPMPEVRDVYSLF